VDWSELYATPAAPLDSLRERMLAETSGMLNAFHRSLAKEDGPGAIVECTPIRVGRYPQLLVELARRTKVHIVASTGFWCEALAPQHPWAVRLGIEPEGPGKMADLFVREIAEGMEDPAGGRGERFTTIRAGAIKIGTSALMRPSEKAVHIGAAMASRRTGCPITTHTTNGGGLQQARLLLESGGRSGTYVDLEKALQGIKHPRPYNPKYPFAIDHIVYNRFLDGLVVEEETFFDVRADKYSDHLPLFTVFDLARSGGSED